MSTNERPALYRGRHRKAWLNEWTVALVISAIALATILAMAATDSAAS